VWFDGTERLERTWGLFLFDAANSTPRDCIAGRFFVTPTKDKEALYDDAPVFRAL
jgi:hypothetical protein